MDRLRFGTFLGPNILPVYQAVAEDVGLSLGIETELVVESDYESCTEDRHDVCFVCSLVYVELELRGIAPMVPVAALVLQDDRYGDRPIYCSDVIVHRDSRRGPTPPPTATGAARRRLTRRAALQHADPRVAMLQCCCQLVAHYLSPPPEDARRLPAAPNANECCSIANPGVAHAAILLSARTDQLYVERSFDGPSAIPATQA